MCSCTHCLSPLPPSCPPVPPLVFPSLCTTFVGCWQVNCLGDAQLRCQTNMWMGDRGKLGRCLAGVQSECVWTAWFPWVLAYRFVGGALWVECNLLLQNSTAWKITSIRPRGVRMVEKPAHGAWRFHLKLAVVLQNRLVFETAGFYWSTCTGQISWT